MSGRQVAQADLARRQLVADDDREVGLVACCGLELLAELARPSSARAAIPAARRSVAILSRPTVSSGSAPTTTATGVGSAGVSAPVSVMARISRSRPIPNPIPGVGRPPRSSTRPS